ncbi:hypothetical protein [Dongshaea marina]|uniref:hypothetical protein n=1 Tax=Dongshaea marina TaxID=2047966 RepID=UPI000D3ECDF0|nr:hypothetical protein [Dongshaea marina]
MITQNDPLTRYLKSNGYTPQPHRYYGSDFISGMQVQLNDLDLIYSVEDDTLVISQITAMGQSDGLAGAVQNLFKLIHTIEKLDLGLTKVRGMVLDDLGDYQEQKKLRRLQEAYLAQGAYYEEVNGKKIIIYQLKDSNTSGVNQDTYIT